MTDMEKLKLTSSELEKLTKKLKELEPYLNLVQNQLLI